MTNNREWDSRDYEEEESSGSRKEVAIVENTTSGEECSEGTKSVVGSPKKQLLKTKGLDKANQVTVTSSKRSAEDHILDASTSKKAKQISKPVSGKIEDAKRSFFPRIWSEGDEIAVLKGMVKFSEENKVDPNANFAAFHEFMKDKLELTVTKVQLQDKIRRLKKKFKKHEENDKKNPIFAKPHERKCYKQSKKIWGGKEVSQKMSGKVSENQEKNMENNESMAIANATNKDSVGCDNQILSLYEDMERLEKELFEGDETDSDKWAKLRRAEMANYSEIFALKNAQTKHVMDFMESFPSLI